MSNTEIKPVQIAGEIPTEQEIRAIITEARFEAKKAATRMLATAFDGDDVGSCGFAWVTVSEYKGKKIDGRQKIGRNMTKAGFGKDHVRRFQIWNPSGLPVQNIDAKEAGAQAAAKVFESYGFKAFAGSRLD